MQRQIKRLLGAAIFIAGLWMAYDSWIRSASDYAIVFAEVTVLRTPIAGIVTHELRLGGTLEPKGVAATVNNPWFDDTYLVGLESRAEALQRGDKAFQAHTDGLEQSKLTMVAQARARRALQANQTEALVREAAARETEASISATFAAQRRQRAEGLTEAGISSQEALETARLTEASAQSENEAQRFLTQSLKIASEAANHGMTVSNSVVGDSAYAEQRKDSISLDLLTLGRERELFDTDRLDVEQRLASERKRAARMRSAQLTVPSDVRVWAVNAASGEYLAPGQAVAEFLRCDTRQVYAQVSERTFGSLVVGAKARFSPKGESAVYFGSVSQLVGPWLLADGRLGSARLPTPSATSRPHEYGVILRFPELEQKGGSDCSIGRAGTVIFGKWL